MADADDITVQSPIPDAWRNASRPVVLGIDEAGRGPVLGPMVYGCAFWPADENEEIKALNFDDSKALSAQQRARLFTRLKECGRIGWVTVSIAASTIAARMLQRHPYNLNAMSHDCAASMVQMVLDAGVAIHEVFVDTVGDPQRYEDKLTRLFSNRVKFTVRKKADAIYPCVSAASICAKVTRDQAMEDWRFREPGFESKGPLGSGYPGDRPTKEWLRQNCDPVFGYPDLVRFSWSTAKDLLDPEKTPGVCVGVDWGDEDEDDDPNKAAAAGSAKMTTFFSPSAGAAAGGARRQRAKFYTRRKMKRVDFL